MAMPKTSKLLRVCLLLTLLTMLAQFTGKSSSIVGSAPPSSAQTHVHGVSPATDVQASYESAEAFYDRMHRRHPDMPVPKRTLPVAIDGRITPDAIPDDVAYRHFIIAMGVRRNASKEEIARRNAMLRVVGLTPEDQKALIGALADVSDELAGIAAERREFPRASGLNTTTLAAEAVLRRREGEIFDKARAKLLSLSSEGRVGLEEHVRNHVRRRIVVYRDVPSR